MDNEKKYIKNFLKYSKEMDLSSAIDKAIAVDLLGESFIEKLGADQRSYKVCCHSKQLPKTITNWQ